MSSGWGVTVCPACGGKSEVTDTRLRKRDQGSVRRRRRCTKCPRQWTTIEIAHEDRAALTQFERNKLIGAAGFIAKTMQKLNLKTDDE